MTKLNEIIEFAKANNWDINTVLDSWNADKEKCIATYKKAKNGHYRDIGEAFGEGVVHFNKIIDRENDKTPKGLTQSELSLLRHILDRVEHDVRYNPTENALWVLIEISSSFSEEIHEEHLIFEAIPNYKKDEGIQNAIDACISQLKYEYLVNL